MRQAPLANGPASWADPLLAILTRPDATERPDALAVVRSKSWPNTEAARLSRALVALASNPTRPVAERIEALASVPTPGFALDAPQLDAALAALAPDAPAADRPFALDALGRAGLTDVQQARLADALAEVGPIELRRLLSVFDRASAPDVGRRLVDALSRSTALANVRPEDLKPLLDRFGDPVRPAAQALLDRMAADRAEQSKRLEALLANLASGDVRRGQAVFQSARAACSTCHAMGYLGGQVGPDLTRIGAIRTERDLLESIVFPSASFVRSYEPVAVATADGRIVNGLLRHDTPEALVLTLDAKTEARIPRNDVAEMAPGTVSVMPAGLDQQLTPQELADLVAFLRAAK
jgi:putative heme-binding domain-containing protein